jgi:hypothetical protein
MMIEEPVDRRVRWTAIGIRDVADHSEHDRALWCRQLRSSGCAAAEDQSRGDGA